MCGFRKVVEWRFVVLFLGLNACRVLRFHGRDTAPPPREKQKGREDVTLYTVVDGEGGMLCGLEYRV